MSQEQNATETNCCLCPPRSGMSIGMNIGMNIGTIFPAWGKKSMRIFPFREITAPIDCAATKKAVPNWHQFTKTKF